LTERESVPDTPRMSLLESTRRMLDQELKKGRSLREISNLSDGKVDYEWLRKYASGKSPDPTVSRVQGLHDSLIEIRTKPSKSEIN